VDTYAAITYPTTVPWTANGYNGVFNLLGVAAGSGTFANPEPSKYAASQSSNLDGTRVARMATNHSSASNSESHTGQQSNNWWKADFTAGHTMQLTRFGILGRTGGTHPGAFVVQGSNDDAAWTDLLTVASSGIADNTWSSWAVTGAAGYRFIRIFMATYGYLVLGEVEMWGTLG